MTKLKVRITKELLEKKIHLKCQPLTENDAI